MAIFKCSLEENNKISITVDSDNDIRVSIEDDIGYSVIYLDKVTAQKVSNKLNELLIGGYGNE